MKKILSCILCLMLLLSFAISAGASELPLVIDQAGLLDEYDIQSLTEMAQSIGDQYGIDAVVLTVDSLNGQPAQSYADDYYDHNGYSENGVLMLLAMAEREYYITTCGEATYALTDYALYQMEDGFLNELSDGAYFDAFHSYLWDVDYYVREYYENGAVDGYVPEEDRYEGHTDVVYADEDLSDVVWLLSLAGGLIIGGVGLLIMRKGMNTKGRQHAAAEYMDKDSYDMTRREDIFLYSRITKQKIPEPSDNDGGGSGVHRSSSGRSHGGRGGKF